MARQEANPHPLLPLRKVNQDVSPPDPSHPLVNSGFQSIQTHSLSAEITWERVLNPEKDYRSRDRRNRWPENGLRRWEAPISFGLEL